MLSALFSRKPPLDEPSIEWIFDTFAWALRHLDAGVFARETFLVVPTNDHFPGRADSARGMAELIFARVAGYAGMGHWPWRLVDANLVEELPQQRVRIEGALRGSDGIAPAEPPKGGALAVPYEPLLVGNPEALIAHFAHTLAHYLATTAPEPPPGGVENWPHVTELVAVFMGFGLMFANSAFIRPRGCGSCGPAAERRSALSQHDITYALALFGVLKGVTKETRPHLKSALRGFHRQCVRDIERRGDRLAALRAVMNANS